MGPSETEKALAPGREIAPDAAAGTGDEGPLIRLGFAAPPVSLRVGPRV